jgi:hypothetical protein
MSDYAKAIVGLSIIAIYGVSLMLAAYMSCTCHESSKQVQVCVKKE